MRDATLRCLRRPAASGTSPPLLPGSVSPTRLPDPSPTTHSAHPDPAPEVPTRGHRLLLPRLRPTTAGRAALPGLQHRRHPPRPGRNLPLLQRDHPHQRAPHQQPLTTTLDLGMITAPKLNQTPTRSLHTGEPVVPSSWRATPRRRSWSGSSRTAVGSTSRPGSPSRSLCTSSPTRSWARRSRTASTTSRPTPARSPSARPRHLGVRRRDTAPLAGHRRASPLHRRRPAADLRRRRWLQRVPGPHLEDRTRRVRRRHRPPGHRLPPASGNP